MLMGATNVQVCTAVMHHGFRIVGDMIDGLNNYLDDRGLASQRDRSGRRCRASSTGTISTSTTRSSPTSIRTRASTATSATSRAKMPRTSASTGCVDERGAATLKVDEEHCVGCNLCSMVCPVDDCITMVRVDTGRRAWKHAGENGYRYHRNAAGPSSRRPTLSRPTF